MLALSFVASCTNPSGDLPISGAISDANDAKAALSTLQQYEDTVSATWKELDQADSVKIADIARLVLEMSYARGTVPANDFNDLQRLLTNAQATRLKPADQYSNTALQKYDALTDSLTDKVLKVNAKLKLANKLKPIMTELSESIDQDENNVIIKRAMYDEAAKKYNEYLAQKKSMIDQLDSTVAAKPVKAYFTLNSSL
jgi:hypothetical protein